MRIMTTGMQIAMAGLAFKIVTLVMPYSADMSPSRSRADRMLRDVRAAVLPITTTTEHQASTSPLILPLIGGDGATVEALKRSLR